MSEETQTTESSSGTQTGSIVENPTETPQVGSEPAQTQEDPSAVVRKFQAERDRLAAEKAAKEQEVARLSSELKKRMDAEEREKYEMAEELSRERAAREEMEGRLRREQDSKLKQEILTEFPEMKAFENDMDFSGMTKEEAMGNVKEWKKQLEKYEEIKGSRQSQEGTPPSVESSKISAGDAGEVSGDKFRQLSREEREKILIARGILTPSVRPKRK